MTKQFKWWLAYSVGTALLSFGFNWVVFTQIDPTIYLALSLFETIMFSLLTIVSMAFMPK
jgi:hypothetical protein